MSYYTTNFFLNTSILQSFYKSIYSLSNVMTLKIGQRD